MLMFANTYEVYLAGIPVTLQKMGVFILAPTVRLLGYRSFYPELSNAKAPR